MDLIIFLIQHLSYQVVFTCLLSVPLTHLGGLLLYKQLGSTVTTSVGGRHASFPSWLLFPFSGGNRHIVFQLCSWGLWCLSLLAMIPVCLPHQGLQLPIIPHTHVDVVSGAAAVASFVGELFMLKALLVYDPCGRRLGWGAPQNGARFVARAKKPGQLVSPAVAVSLVVAMGLALALTGAALLLCLEYMPDIPSRVLYCCMALSCFTISASSTYGLGGHLRYNTPSTAGSSTSGLELTSFSNSADVLQPKVDSDQAKVDTVSNSQQGDASQLVNQESDNGKETGGHEHGLGMFVQGYGQATITSPRPVAESMSQLQQRELALPSVQEGVGRGTAVTAPEAVQARAAAAQQGVPEAPLGPSDGSHPGGEGAGVVGNSLALKLDVSEDSMQKEALTSEQDSDDKTQHAKHAGGKNAVAAAQSVECADTGGGDASAVVDVEFRPGTITTGSRSASAASTQGSSLIQASPAVAAAAAADVPMLDTHLPGGMSRLSVAGTAAAAAVAVAAGGSSSGGERVDAAWRFFQPFAGGTAFVSTQAIGWTLFSVVVVAVAELARRLALGMAYCLRCWALGAGFLMCATQLVLGVSLLTFRSRARARAAASAAACALGPLLTKPRATARSHLSSLGHRISVPLPVVLMYMPIHLFFAVWSLVFAFMPLHSAFAALAGALVPYFIFTLRGEPAHTGCRQWPWLQRFFEQHVEASLTFWCGGIEVVQDWDSSTDIPTESQRASNAHNTLLITSQGTHSCGARCNHGDGSGGGRDEMAANNKYIMGLHPHGFFPCGAGFLPLCPSFRQTLPGVPRPTTLTASVVHYAPGVRDVAMWAGFRQVSRATFRRALDETRCVLLCPGGQAELVYADRRIATDGVEEMVVYAGHKGFVREALVQGAALVPVLAIGETLLLRNMCHWPSLLRYTYKRLGFPVPLLLSGRGTLTTLPLAGVGPLVYAVGRPIPPPPGLVPGGPVPEELVSQVHAQFYACMEAMWARHHHRHPILKHARLRMIWDDQLS